MKIVSSTMLGIVLTAAMFSAGVVVDRVTNTYVTNFPLDAQGNLRVTQMNKGQNVTVTNLPLDEKGNLQVSFKKTTKVITVAKDLNLSWVFASKTLYFPNTISADGFSEVNVFASVSYATIGPFDFGYNVIGSTDGIEVELPSESGRTGMYRNDALSPLPLNISARFSVWAPEFKMQLWTYGSSAQYPNGWMLVSVSLYMRN